MSTPAPSLSVVALFLNADFVVKSVMLLLLFASIWSWTVIIEKLFLLGSVSRSALPHEARAAGARSPAELLPPDRVQVGDTAGLVLASGVQEREASIPSETVLERRERIEKAMRLTLSSELRRLEQRLPFLATLGSAAPFIGLFGTVWGIMRSFAGIAAANNTSLAVVAPGIAEALFATAMGLAAAIPAVIAYNKITVELGRFAGRMQNLIGRSGNLLSRIA